MDKISNERKAQIFYQGDGTQTQYSFPFDYLRKAFVHVSLISDEKIEELTQGTDYTVTDRVVTLAAPTGLKIKIYRVTTTKPLVGWADASVLRAADMTVQSTQLLHLAEETSDLAQEGGLSKDGTDNIWDARYNKIKNLLDPTEPGDAVNLNYITKNQNSLLTQLRNTGAAQNASIVSTGDTQNARLTATGDNQNTRLTTTGDTQNKRLTDTGNTYVSTMTTLRDTTTTKATEANNSADLARKWAEAEDSPNGDYGSKSSLGWARDAKESASKAAASASASQSSADSSASYVATASSSANAAKQSALSSTNSASAAATSASNAATSATNAKTSETKAAASAAAAAQSAIDAVKFDPSSYYLKAEVDNKIDAVWDHPLEWDILESPYSILQGTAIIYDENYMPARYRIALLANIIKTNIEGKLQDYALKTAIPTKTSQLTNDSGFAVISNGHLVINGSELWIE